MNVREKRQQSQNSHDFELKLLRFVRHPLGQAVQSQVEIADRKDCGNQNDTHHNHENVGLTRRCDERRQMVRSQWMKLIVHFSPPRLNRHERRDGLIETRLSDEYLAASSVRHHLLR
jgi:hypothetical protein